MSVIWHKVWRDLAHNKARTALMTLSTAAGIFAIGLVFGLSSVMRERMTEEHQAAKPGHINFWSSPFSEDVVQSIRREADVADAEGQTHLPFRWKLEGETEWRNGILVARTNYQDQRMDLIRLMEGHWPVKNTLAVERQSSEYFGIPFSAAIVAERGRREQRLPAAGIVHMPFSFFTPPQMGGDAVFFATPDTVAWLTGYEGFNQLNVQLESFSEEAAEGLAKRIQNRLERMDISVSSHTITAPDLHWLQDTADTMFLILGILGMLSLGLSTFLIINTMNAIIARQVSQIGVMKVLGATLSRVAHVYLATALAYGVFALLPAVPLGAVIAYVMAGWLLDLMSIEEGAFQVVPATVGIQVVVGLAVPLLAALGPVVAGARVTPHRAISSYGLGSRFGQSPLDRLVGRIRHLPRVFALSLRNIFRNKARVALTLLALTFGGTMFIIVMSVNSSLENTLEAVLSDFGFDVLVIFRHPHRATHLTEVTESVAGVAQAEVWEIRGAVLTLDNGTELDISLWGLPPNSTMFDPNIVSGRDLLPEDSRAVLLNRKIAMDENIGVGDEIELTIGGQESIWTVVGLVINVNNLQRDNFVPFDALARETGNSNYGTVVAVSSQQDYEGQVLIEDLRSAYIARNIEALSFESANELRRQNRAQFAVVTYLMLSMIILTTVVGCIGLTSTMSINVVERRREIGVMRAIGATTIATVSIFIGEGVLLGVCSWLLASPISVPSARLFSQAVGNALFQSPLEFSYSTSGLLLWFLIVVTLSALASLWPALRAARVSVREVLVYE